MVDRLFLSVVFIRTMISLSLMKQMLGKNKIVSDSLNDEDQEVASLISVHVYLLIRYCMHVCEFQFVQSA